MKRRDFCRLIATAAAATVTPEPTQLSAQTGKSGQSIATNEKSTLHNNQVWIRLACAPDCLWEYGSMKGGPSYKFSPPAFEIDDQFLTAVVDPPFERQNGTKLANGATEFVFESRFAKQGTLRLILRMQLNDELPLIRFRYELASDQPAKLGGATAGNGAGNRLNYLSVSLQHLPDVQEIQLSNFIGLVHSHMLSALALTPDDFQQKAAVMGPILAASDGQHSFVLAYEHGSPVPDAFLHYELDPNREVRLSAVKANYYSGQPIGASDPYRTVWLETGVVQGSMDKLASSFRTFVLNYMAPTRATREPLIFYNTWNLQERYQWFYGNQSLLAPLNDDRMLKEIDAAHKVGVDVFVIDTGWFNRTGDWQPDPAKFPNGLRTINERLKANGMRLGLWIGPTFAGVNSRAIQEHPEWRMSRNGGIAPPYEIWGTEKSYNMCLVSGYADFFADQLIRVAQETGATDFKWDGVDQYGCDDPHHNHGGPDCTPQERADSYAFQLPICLSRIADKICAAIPNAIVDYDVTESPRDVGLGFLASGRFFLINNGPYEWPDFDMPAQRNQNRELFFYPGQARTWVCRTPLTFDRWIPSTLFLTHYLPDDPEQSQEVNVASLILGQNGIWGDLTRISDMGVAYIGGILAKYKQVRDDVMASDPVVTGVISGSPEIHEKIVPVGRGVVALFATRPGTYTYVTRNKVVDQFWASENTAVVRDNDGKAVITATLKRPGAGIVLFGAQ